MTRERVLLVEDDRDIVTVVKRYLERSDFVVEVAFDGVTGLRSALASPPSLIILDWMLPGLDGVEFIRRLRQEAHTPIVMLTARTEETDRVLGLELGADDYIVKPFSPREMVARVKAVLRRPGPRENRRDGMVVLGPLRINVRHRTVELAGRPIQLTALEFNLLLVLAQQPGRVYSRNELLDRVWGSDFAGVDRVVDVHVSKLRRDCQGFCA